MTSFFLSLTNFMAAIDLPEGYYLSNFHQILENVSRRYDDLLTDAEHTFFHHFRQASPDCQKLFVRLVSRKGPWFLIEKLNYPEIESISDAIQEGQRVGLFQALTLPELDLFLSCLTIKELKALLQALGCPPGGNRKADLFQKVMQYPDRDALLKAAKQQCPAVATQGAECIRLLLLLYFGNGNQDLTEFVLQDLGLMVFESYEILDEHRTFSDRKSIDQRLLIDQLNEMAYVLTEEGPESMLSGLIEVLQNTPWMPQMQNRLSRVYNRLGAYYERQGNLSQALSLFQNSKLHPAAERQARMWDKLGDPQKAKDMAQSLLEHSKDEQELDFARKFIPKCAKKLGETVQPTPRFKVRTYELELEKIPNQAIEQTVLDSLSEQSGFFCENRLWRALFGLTFWDIIFQSVPGAFQNPFQWGPLDLYQPGFIDKRNTSIVDRLNDVRSSSHFASDLLSRFDEKYGIINHFVHWDHNLRECLQIALQHIPQKTLAATFEKLLRDLRRYGAGFPDLFIYSPESGDYWFWEVKGPGDTLRPNQKMWLRFFQECGLPVAVLKVQWKPQ